MVTFLFWNLNRKPLQAVLARLAARHGADVLVLVECEVPQQELTEELARQTGRAYHRTHSICQRVAIYTSLPESALIPVYEEARMTAHRLTLPRRPGILLAAVHFPSKLHWSQASQSAECEELARSIRLAEDGAGHRRTVLVGDLNMDPYEEGVVKANGLNAVMTRRLATRETRTVQAREYPYFYNPMWAHFGDAGGGPSGTYYYEATGHVSYYWHLFDQVLIRPALLPCFRNESLRILVGEGDSALLSARGAPDASRASDHLPILFGLDLEATGD